MEGAIWLPVDGRRERLAVDQRSQAGARLVLLILAGLCAGAAVLHGIHALILLEVESGLIALVLAGGSALISATARTPGSGRSRKFRP